MNYNFGVNPATYYNLNSGSNKNTWNNVYSSNIPKKAGADSSGYNQTKNLEFNARRYFFDPRNNVFNPANRERLVSQQIATNNQGSDAAIAESNAQANRSGLAGSGALLSNQRWLNYVRAKQNAATAFDTRFGMDKADQDWKYGMFRDVTNDAFAYRANKMANTQMAYNVSYNAANARAAKEQADAQKAWGWTSMINPGSWFSGSNKA